MREHLTKVFILTLFVNWCEITLVHSADLLKFWERDSDLDARRNAKHEEHKVRNSDEKEFRYNRGKHRDTTKLTATGNYIAYRSRNESGKHKATQKSTGSDQGKHLRQGKVTEKWPKVQQHFRNQHDYNMASKRMTQMYLMQQPTGEPTNVDALDYLSSYFIANQLKKIMEQFTNANVTTEILGRTVQYNDIVLLKITESRRLSNRYFRAEESKYIDEVPEKKIVFIVHGLSVMGLNLLPCLSMAAGLEVLVWHYLEHLDKFDIFLVPMANPDGYAHVSTVHKWNKNMSPQSACPGVALDRNFDVAWNVTHPISSCSQWYPGPNPFSEAETRAIRDVFHRYSHKIVAYFHVHSGSYDFNYFKGDAVLYPKGYTDAQTDDDKYVDLRGEVDEAMKNASFQVLTVTVDTLHNWYGKISGSSVDYASTIYGIPYALEFVMQPYEGRATQNGTYFAHHALEQIWGRVIDVVFDNIWRNTHSNDVK